MMSVKVYTTSSCPWCKKTKEFLRKHKVKFEEFDVSKEKYAKEALKKSGQMASPVIDINGKIIVGFDESAIKKSLKLK